jgi:hypothetical protein
MRAIVDSIDGKAVQCLVENGDLLNIHIDYLPKGIQPGSILNVSFSLDQKTGKAKKESTKSI